MLVPHTTVGPGRRCPGCGGEVHTKAPPGAPYHPIRNARAVHDRAVVDTCRATGSPGRTLSRSAQPSMAWDRPGWVMGQPRSRASRDATVPRGPAAAVAVPLGAGVAAAGTAAAGPGPERAGGTVTVHPPITARKAAAIAALRIACNGRSRSLWRPVSHALGSTDTAPS
jgi:hypothetical protein